MRFIAVCVKR